MLQITDTSFMVVGGAGTFEGPSLSNVEKTRKN